VGDLYPRDDEGPLELELSVDGFLLRIPLAGGGRLLLGLSSKELRELHLAIAEQAKF